MSTRIKPTTAFRIYANARRANAAAKAFKVYAVKKDGNLYAKPVDFRGAFDNDAEAQARANELMAMNPGSKYTVAS